MKNKHQKMGRIQNLLILSIAELLLLFLAKVYSHSLNVCSNSNANGIKSMNLFMSSVAMVNRSIRVRVLYGCGARA